MAARQLPQETWARGNRRLFSDLYAATAQRERSRLEFWKDDYLAQLRLDSVVTQTIVVPDSHVFDGRYFLETDPSDLIANAGRGAHGRTFPIEVRARAGSLKESLATFLLRADSHRLNGFPLNAIDDEDTRQALARALASTDASVLKSRLQSGTAVPSALAALLRELLAANGYAAVPVIDLLEQGWSRWVEAEARGLLKVTPWRGTLDLRWALALDPIDLDNELFTTAGRELYEQIDGIVRSGSTYRADVTYFWDRARRDLTDSAALLDVQTLEDWYRTARHRAMALQHECAFAHMDDAGATPIGPLRRLARQFENSGFAGAVGAITMPETLLPGLAALPGEEFGAFFLRAHSDLVAWWEDGDRDGLRRAIDILVATVSERMPHRAGPRGLVQLFATVAPPAVTAALSPMSVGHQVVGVGLVTALCTAVTLGLPRRPPTRRIVEFCLQRARQD